MQIQSGLSLMDYLNDPARSQQALDRAVQYQQQNVAGELTELDAGIGQMSDGQIDETLKKIEEGQSSVSLKSLDNMIAFYMKPVAGQLQDLAERFGIKEQTQIKHIDGHWQVEGAEADDAAPELQRLQQYLDADQGLQKRMDQLNRLSEFYEWGLTRDNAAQLKEAKVADDDVVAYLKQGRSHLMGMDSFTLSTSELQLNSRGEAQHLYDAAKKLFGIAESKS